MGSCFSSWNLATFSNVTNNSFAALCSACHRLLGNSGWKGISCLPGTQTKFICVRTQFRCSVVSLIPTFLGSVSSQDADDAPVGGVGVQSDPLLFGGELWRCRGKRQSLGSPTEQGEFGRPTRASVCSVVFLPPFRSLSPCILSLQPKSKSSQAPFS